MNKLLTPERRSKAQEVGADVTRILESVLHRLNDLKGEERDHLARYCVIAVTDIEKIISYVMIHIVEVVPKKEIED